MQFIKVNNDALAIIEIAKYILIIFGIFNPNSFLPTKISVSQTSFLIVQVLPTLRKI